MSDTRVPDVSVPDVSVIVVAYDRVHDVDACLRSVRAQTLSRFECLVVLNGASPELTALVNDHARDDARIHPLVIARTSASTARNLANQKARAALIHYLDDDVIAPPDLLERVIARMGELPAVGIFGGPNLTPPDEPAFCQITGALLAGRFGTGIARARYRRVAEGPAEECDLILCNLVVRRSVIASGVAFPGLFGGEENALMGDAVSRGVGLWYSPDAWVHHRRRRTLPAYLEQVRRYGAGRANAMMLAPNTVRLAYFAPPAFVAYLLVLPALAFVSPFALAPLALYGALDVGASLVTAVSNRAPSWFLPLLALHPITHVAYGLGLAQRWFELSTARARRENPAP